MRRTIPTLAALAAALVLVVAPAQAQTGSHGHHHHPRPVSGAEAQAASEQLAVFSGEGSEYGIERCWAQGRHKAAGCSMWITLTSSSFGLPGRLTVHTEAWREGSLVCAQAEHSLIEEEESWCVEVPH